MKSINNKNLVIILAALIAVFVLARVFRSPKLESNLAESLVSTDTATVDRLIVHPRSANGEAFEFTRKGKDWRVRHAEGGKEASADASAVQAALGYLVKMVPQKVVTRKAEKYGQFDVGDTTTRVQVFQGKELLAELRIGRTDFAMPSGGMQNPFGGGGMPGGSTFVRVGEDAQVYAVEGFLESAFNRSFDEWRDKALLRLRAGDVTRVRFDYPDSAFVLEKQGKNWQVDGAEADSAAVRNFLSSMEYRNGNGFVDDFQPSTPTYSISFEGEKGALVVMKAWKRETDVVVGSSANPGVMMKVNDRDALFGIKREFLKK